MRKLIESSVLFAVFTLAALSVAQTPVAGSHEPDLQAPNIVIILADDLGYGDIGVNGAELISTPHIDALAAAGVRLTNYYAPANVCTPSRAGMLTGRQPIRMGLANSVIYPQSTHGLPADELTLAEMLGARGYRTAMIGKWHLGHTPEFWPTEHGFDTFFGVPYSNDMKPFPLYNGSVIVQEEANQAELTERYTRAAQAVIAAPDDAPFFLYLAHTFPHIPLFADAPFRGQSKAGLYGDTVQTIDWSTGQILRTLAESGKLENTLVILTSDNGPWFEGSSGQSRDRKGTTWEGAYRVPFIASWPAALPADTVRAAPITGLDLFPTIAALTGAALPPGLELDGRDVWPVLSKGAGSPHPYLVFFNEDQIAAIRKDNWRLVVRSYYKQYDVPLAVSSYPLLFNLLLDPEERYSFTPDEPELVQQLLAHIQAENERFSVPPAPPFPPR